ncbi:uncharacterized protein N7496_004152 [Penicillium cataractarum]|uniref:Uncharacterized protein n=1 Tax=Penicillium cataractarum TaxID=2100454 RepID=A0A9W9SQP5_9EURO|nr:uncharacterized protein N7496_004152 [Penicillium cataractarum]KAJ5381724.1 hypothetical protein N7496_004152 [Penicillium cataractarum]
MNVARKQPCSKSVPESEVVEILLDSMIPILIDYEREANKEGQTGVPWSGLSGMITSHCLPSDPNLVELSFVDRLAKARDELWQQQRIQKDPNVLELSACWARGLPIQHLVHSSVWLFHAMRNGDQAPFLSSRANQILYSPITTIMHRITKDGDLIDGYVDNLQFIIRAFLQNDEREEKVRDVLRVWEYYSQLLKPHPVYLEMFQDWLANMIQNREDMLEATKIIRPPSLPVRLTISPVPTGSEIIEWDPREGNYPPPDRVHNDDELFKSEEPRNIRCTVLNCRMMGGIPSEAPFVRARKPQPLPRPVSIWSTALRSPSPDSQDTSYSVQDSVVLAAILFLDTFTKTPRLLRTRFPDVEFPRYTPIYLADEFIAFESKRNPNEVLGLPIRVLKDYAKKVPSQILHDLIWSFLDTLKAEPNAPMYSKLLFATLDLIEILLRTDKPQLAINLLIRLWMEFANESSLHRKLSLVKLGRILTPDQAGEMMRGLASRVCDALQAQDQQGEKMAKGEDKPFVKVTTAKMLAQALAEADFLSQSDQMNILQQMFNSSRHIDIRSAIVTSLLGLVENSDNDEPYKVFTSISASVAGPNERAKTTEAEWDLAENQRGPLPYVAPVSERPLLDLMVSTAAFKLPERLRSDYVRNVLLPLLQDSTAQHTRWMAAMSARLGCSITDLNITDQEIGPFVPDLPDRILWGWTRYLPGSYLEQCHRPWSLSFLGDGAFSSLDKALAATDDQALKHINVRDHWDRLLKSRRARPALYNLNRLLDSIGSTGTNVSNGLNTTLVLEEFAIRAESIIRNPVKYSETLKKYTVCPNSVVEPLRALRNSRVQTRNSAANQATIYNEITDVMRRMVDVVETVRKEGWSTTLTAYPATLPSTFEFDLLLLPSPIYIPTATESNPALDLFTSALVDLIRKYACDPRLLLKLDAFKPVMQEIPLATLKRCSLRLGRFTQPEEDGLIVTCVRVKLAHLLLDRVRPNRPLFDVDMLEMIDEWKKSDVELVRQIGWE